ncbi:MAG: fibrobacter succinogenes major paralogous domain-containing protein [Paludibacter sp.]
MKTILKIFLSLFLIVHASFAQDTLYVYKAGAVAYKSEISSVDSVTFKKVYAPKPITITDIDGNVYQTVKIGTQTWMASNLRVTHYRNGEVIPNLTVGSDWANTGIGAWCDYSNLAANGNKYGHLYNWYAVSDTRNLAPTGWHIATLTDLATLKNYLGGANVAGGKLKESGTNNWVSPNQGATNETGFSALPGGDCWYGNGTFENVNYYGFWWTSNNSTTDHAYSFRMKNDNSILDDTWTLIKSNGLSVRCVKD